MRLAAILAVTATPALSCELHSVSVLSYTHHAAAAIDFDEGAGPRGVTVTGTCGDWTISGTALDHSGQGNDPGYIVSAQHEATTYRWGDFSVGLIGGIGHYPDKPFPILEETGGLFPMIGLNAVYAWDQVFVYAQVYPMHEDMDARALITAGVGIALGGE